MRVGEGGLGRGGEERERVSFGRAESVVREEGGKEGERMLVVGLGNK